MDIEHPAPFTTPQPEPTSRPEPRPASTIPASTITALLPPAQRDVLRQALADAVYYRDPPLYCHACETLDGLCGQCTAGLSQAMAYVTLSRELGISPEDLADATPH
jgi:hypothetical protein